MQQNVFVTGGAGYIGSHVCKALQEAGYQPVSLDDLSKGHRELVQFGPLEEGDIRNEAWLDRCFAKYSPCAVVHCAGRADVAESLIDPSLYYSINVAGTLALLKSMQRHQVKHLLFSSSCATYGEVPVDALQISESTPQVPIHPYGRSKWMAEQLCIDAFHAYGMVYGFLRYFNAAGADSAGKIGEWHEPETHLIPILLQTALKKRPYFSLFGGDYPTPDGSAIRDYIHVTDLANAHVKALAHLRKNNHCLTLNLGAGVGHSVKQVLHAAQEITGREIPTKLEVRRPKDPPSLIANIAKARAELDWQPVHSSLNNVLLTAWQWISK